MNFAKDVAIGLGDLVDYWVTFNEGHVYVLLSNCVGMWPPGRDTNTFDEVACILRPGGPYKTGVSNMARAHREFYDFVHGPASPVQSKSVGIAHSVAVMDHANFAGRVMNSMEKIMTDTKFGFVDEIKGHMDWLGLNYYGKEFLGNTGPMIVDTEQYSDSGRAIYPDGLYELLMMFHERYTGKSGVRFSSYIVTENGVSDSKDNLRPAYITEHLLAVREAQRQGVPIEGFVHWTVSDNWEWADGYCPQFGLVKVDRTTQNFNRTKRGSYDHWKKIVTTKKITKQMRDSAWNIVHEAALRAETQDFCRDTKSNDGRGSLHMPEPRVLNTKDWRFTQLSSAEGNCYKTPWVPQTDGVSAANDGSCVVQEKGACPLTAKLQRELRCPRHDVVVREVRNVVCTVQESHCTDFTSESVSKLSQMVIL